MKPWTPPVVPPGLWERPEMAQALAERDMGAVSRIYRRWTGASQNDVGMLVGMPQPHVSELERGGRKVVALDLFERFADGLGIPRRMLGLSGSDADSGEGGTDPVVGRSQHSWLKTRRFLGRHRAKLTRQISRLYPESIRLGQTGLLMPPNWRLRAPIDLARVELNWRQDADRPRVTGGERETRRLRPIADSGREYDRYHRAMRDLARPRLFENRLCYRLLDVLSDETANLPPLRVTLGEMCYFDMIDVGESLAHEAALAGADQHENLVADRIAWQNLPFRRLLRDPFTLANYPLMTSVSTLTIRRSGSGVSFFLLRRDPGKVAIAGGLLSVFPTGVFQPASVLRAPHSPDFDLWRNVMREYSEEFLGNPEHDGGGAPVDYENEEPFRSLDAARRRGRINVYCLGIGVDALNYVGDLLTVAVFEADVFDRIFDGMVDKNDEGELASEELAFDAPTMDRLLGEGSMAPSGAACLHLAWRHRDVILSREQ
ncbi:helix-turn-helix domain-containing protein [Plantactinospora sonchi]|uniref:Helix-turn-helix transcriptional regulator n=1 Tax=Plantactinospora sonchi TaxID=1544735 RepID=A0ABU7RXF3_9ACTN